MSKTVAVGFEDHYFWAFDVSFALLTLEAILVAQERAADGAPADDGVLEELRLSALLLAERGLQLDAFTEEQRTQMLDWYAEAGRRLRVRGPMSAEDAHARYVVKGEPVFLRGYDPVDTAAAADIVDSMNALVAGSLPPAPGGRHWFVGSPAGGITSL